MAGNASGREERQLRERPRQVSGSPPTSAAVDRPGWPLGVGRVNGTQTGRNRVRRELPDQKDGSESSWVSAEMSPEHGCLVSLIVQGQRLQVGTSYRILVPLRNRYPQMLKLRLQLQGSTALKDTSVVAICVGGGVGGTPASGPHDLHLWGPQDPGAGALSTSLRQD